MDRSGYTLPPVVYIRISLSTPATTLYSSKIGTSILENCVLAVFHLTSLTEYFSQSTKRMRCFHRSPSRKKTRV